MKTVTQILYPLSIYIDKHLLLCKKSTILPSMLSTFIHLKMLSYAAMKYMFSYHVGENGAAEAKTNASG
jgi:hypothetical protein